MPVIEPHVIEPHVIEPHAIRLVANPNADPKAAYGPELRAILDSAGLEAARREISAWPGYAPTPLIALPGLAARAGLGAVWYKDEGERFGLGSFKALGGAYAVARLLCREIEARAGAVTVGTSDLLSGVHRGVVADITVCTATDGNHGRSVAWGARTFGCACVIYIHATVSEGRKAAIESFGAEVRRVSGNYDDSVRRAAADSAANGWHLVSDTSWEGYSDIPRDVMHGYMVMADEAIGQFPGGAAPSHVFVQGGVGGLAAAVLAVFWDRFGARRPRFVVAEPENAACLYESARAGRRIAVTGDLDTLMAGLAAGEVSLLAWDILRAGCDALATVSDAAARDLMRLLADGCGGDPPIVAGESAVAGLAAAVAAVRDTGQARTLGLDGGSRILVIGSEGATDPALYREIVGRTAEEVGGSQ